MTLVKQVFNSASSGSIPLLLDGAIGTLLLSRGIKSDSYAWMSHANILYPEFVKDVHSEYISAGADIITTNTFRTNPAALYNSGFTSEHLVQTAVGLAKEARKDFPHILLAGSNAPAEDCYQYKRNLTLNELRNNHHKHIDLLMSAGCDFILNETQSHLDEIKIICQYCSENNIPYVLSIFCTNELKLLSGEDLLSIMPIIASFSPVTIGFNCMHPDIFSKIMNSYIPVIPWGFYLNLGLGNYSDDKITNSLDESSYLKSIKMYLKYNPSFIGACCGSAPSHINVIREYVDELYRN